MYNRQFRNFLIWSGKTAVNDKNFSIAFYRALSFALVNRHMAVDDMAFSDPVRIHGADCLQLPRFPEDDSKHFCFFMRFLIFNKITLKSGHLVFPK